MMTTNASLVLDRLIEPLSGCLNEESARRLLSLRADAKLQARVDVLSRKCEAGTLTAAERDEYQSYVSYARFIATLKSKVRLRLAEAGKVK